MSKRPHSHSNTVPEIDIVVYWYQKCRHVISYLKSAYEILFILMACNSWNLSIIGEITNYMYYIFRFIIKTACFLSSWHIKLAQNKTSKGKNQNCPILNLFSRNTQGSDSSTKTIYSISSCC